MGCSGRVTSREAFGAVDVTVCVVCARASTFARPALRASRSQLPGGFACWRSCHVTPVTDASRVDISKSQPTSSARTAPGSTSARRARSCPTIGLFTSLAPRVFYVDDANTCGASSEKSRLFDVTVPEDGGADIFDQAQLPHTSVCFCPLPEDCDDNADISATALNNKDD
jgi:hypothetical protein